MKNDNYNRNDYDYSDRFTPEVVIEKQEEKEKLYRSEKDYQKRKNGQNLKGASIIFLIMAFFWGMFTVLFGIICGLSDEIIFPVWLPMFFVTIMWVVLFIFLKSLAKKQELKENVVKKSQDILDSGDYVYANLENESAYEKMTDREKVIYLEERVKELQERVNELENE